MWKLSTTGSSQPKADIKAEVVLEASVSPSEDPGKVLKAMEEVTGDVPRSVRVTPSSIRIESDAAALVKVHDQLRDRRVRAAARRLALAGREGKRFTVMLNRQAAYVGVIALCSAEAESPLGPIFLTVRAPDIDAVLTWLTDYEVR